MSDQFVETLSAQLRAAAEREASRGPVARRTAGTRAALPRISAGALATAAAVILAVVLGGYFLVAVEPQQPVRTGPAVVARFAPAQAVGSVASGFGSVWVADPQRHQVLRIDPATDRVLARIPVAGTPVLSVGPTAVWALSVPPNAPGAQPLERLSRIDPRTNRVQARITLRTPRGDAFFAGRMRAEGDAVWVFGTGALRVDARTNRPTLAVQPDTTFDMADATVHGRDLCLLLADGRLLLYDSVSGARRAVARLPEVGRLTFAGDALILRAGQEVARVDPRTGALRWRTALRPAQTAAVDDAGAVIADGVLWLAAEQEHGGTLRLVGLDPATGDVRATVPLPGVFSASGLASAGGRLWLAAPLDHVVVIRP